MKNKMVSVLMMLCFSLSAAANNGGISLDSTRVVYDLKCKSYDVHVKKIRYITGLSYLVLDRVRRGRKK